VKTWSHLYDRALDGVDANDTSLQERIYKELLTERVFTYGEVIFPNFLPMLEFAKPKPGEVFYDLGCGSGQPLMVAALAFPSLSKCVGIELLENLAALGVQVTGKLTTLCREANIQCSPITVSQGDMLQQDWSDADIVFAASVCFSNELLDGFADRCSRLKKGSRILFMNYLPERPYLREVASWKGQFTWGLHLCRFYVTV